MEVVCENEASFYNMMMLLFSHATLFRSIGARELTRKTMIR